MFDRTTQGRKADVRRDVAQFAVDAFKDHVITRVSDERWRCVQRKVCEKCTGNGQVQPEGSEAFEQCKNCAGRGWYEPWTYGFYVIHFGQMTILTGDVGNCIWRSGATLEQLAAEDSYCLSKIEDAKKDFYPEELIASVDFDIAEIDKELSEYKPDDELEHPETTRTRRAKLVELRDQLAEENAHGDFHAMRAYEIFEEHRQEDIGETLNAAYGYTSGHFWHVEALRLFVRLKAAMPNAA